MRYMKLRAMLALTLAALSLAATAPMAYGVQRDLFANYYVRPGRAGGIPAQMYISPVPVPAYVGHTFVTYQPFDPHEALYHHHRTYYRYYPEGGFSTTHVKWW